MAGAEVKGCHPSGLCHYVAASRERNLSYRRTRTKSRERMTERIPWCAWIVLVVGVIKELTTILMVFYQIVSDNVKTDSRSATPIPVSIGLVFDHRDCGTG